MSRKLTVIALSLLVALVGCQKEAAIALRARAGSYLSSQADAVFISVAVSGDWSLRLEYPTGVEPWASGILPASGSGSQDNVLLSFSANGTDKSRKLDVVLTSASGSTARLTFRQAAKPPVGVKGQYGMDVASAEWLELPACVAGDGREVLAHNMSGGKYGGKNPGTRNWSCYWDYREHMSLWVAYPLNNSLKGSGSRSDEWGWDAILPHNLQPNIISGSYGGGWTRGHQIPSADRLSPRSANVSTFVPTNMTPQAYDFNGGIWANLEGKVRNYAALSDTLYVVTGALFDASTSTSDTSSGFAVKIPTHYFKALLYRGTSAYAKNTDGFMMAGFILPHDNGIANASPLNYRVSIDELERQTGIDFFPQFARMNEELSAQLEAATPNAQFWN